ncbi:hypothetical protein IP86_03085 [Rhodopseudomonas sp. AAP120]|uniref:hypothetical protein n=1 Tax=Rhodopseudomonas sp. AAP120 TaxID=1523430 RepID=UPI0006B8F376|nr:hypothetical protein [Rhodopseudomonas sp. AAP120]KPG01807.1 hypothetical protein IP86_03085 [Rhodopseudomonas sp. AAP120]
MRCVIILFPIVPRPRFDYPDWMEQFGRERDARLAMRFEPPPRTRPVALTAAPKRQAEAIDRDNYQQMLDSIAAFMNEGRAAFEREA